MNRLIAAAAVILMALGTLSAVPTAAAPAQATPSQLVQRAAGKTISAGGWTNQTSVQARFQVTGTGEPLAPQVEWRPADQPFTGRPTVIGKPVTTTEGRSTTLGVQISGLKESGGYIWQARVIDNSGYTSDWTQFSDGSHPALSVDLTRPTQPGISSSTNPKPGAWYNTKTERFSWKGSDTVSGIAGFSVRFDHSTTGNPGKVSAPNSIVMKKLSDGRWVLHVWAQDRAGNWSRAGVYPFNLDTTAPRLRFVSVDNGTYNPYVGKETWRFSTDERAHLTAYVMRSGRSTPVDRFELGTWSAGTHYAWWDGKDSESNVAPAGWYWLSIKAVDKLGNTSNTGFGGIHVAPRKPSGEKRIVVSLSQQKLWAYQGSTVVWTSLVTTGNPALPTPTGHFHIFAKYHPYEMISPWPYGSPYYYPPSWMSYAMAFIEGGYFIHDAPWRSVFGPGSNGPGKPGTNYGGTHGCVNVPTDTAAYLFGWAPVGTTVDVVS